MRAFTQRASSLKTRIALDIVQTIERLSAVYGSYAWGVRCEEDNVLRLDFGSPRLTVQEPEPKYRPDRRIVVATGQWHLFVFDGDWEIEAGTLRLTRRQLDEGSAEISTRCLSNLNGQKVVSVDWQSDGKVWIFNFDLGGRLSVRKDENHSINDDVDSEWTMFFADEGSLSCVVDDKCIWEHEPA